MRIFKLYLIFFPFLVAFSDPYDFLSSDGVISTKQIEIPGYRSAYNPSLIPYEDGYLLSFRVAYKKPIGAKKHFRSDFSFLGLAKLTKELEVIEDSVQLLDIRSHSPEFSLSAEDARLIRKGEDIWMFFNDIHPLKARPGFFMYFAKIVKHQDGFALEKEATQMDYAHACPVEKNWSPFLFQDRVFLIYSGEPWTILELDLISGKCHDVSSTVCDWSWPYGEVRGGTPAIPTDDGYLSFFHSSCFMAGENKRTYFMGVYTFEKSFPFNPTGVTKVPIGTEKDYTEENGKKVVFPGGLVDAGDELLVAWGKGDKKIIISTLDKQKILHSVKPL